MRLTTENLDLTLTEPFRIARGTQTHAHNVLVRLDDGDGNTGIGEAAPSGHYGERRETVCAALGYLEDGLGDDPDQIEDIVAAFDRTLGVNAAAKAALDMALHDLVAKRLGVPVYRLLGLNAARAPQTSFTVGIDAPEEMARKARAATEAGYPILKVKLGTDDDLGILTAVREATDATLRVDANAAWTPKHAVRMASVLEDFGVEFLEQPVAAADLDGLAFVRERSPLPIFADESCITVADIPRLVGKVDGINIKLMKCGGLRSALRMIHVARAHHLRVMLGCMIESAVAITAAAHLSPLVDYADLDGHLLVSDDPFEGVKVEQGKLVLPNRPGLGIRMHDTKRPARREPSSSGAHLLGD